MNTTEELFKEFKKGFNKLRNEVIYSGCYHKCDQCSEKIIKAHSIQNNRILNKLSLNGEVLYFQLDSVDDETANAKFELNSIGRRKATTFTGFCGKHDNEIFKPIEENDYVIGNKEQEFLFAYRALAKEYHAKMSEKNLHDRFIELANTGGIEKLKKYFPGIRKYQIKEIEEMYRMQKRAIDDSIKTNEYYKNAMNMSLERKKFNRIYTMVITFDEEYPISVSSTFGLERDLNDNIVNNLKDFSKMIKPLMLTVIPQNGKTYILISCYQKDKELYRGFFKQLDTKEYEDKKVIISNIILTYCENFVVSPDAWEKREAEEKREMMELFNDTILKIDKKISINKKVNLFK